MARKFKELYDKLPSEVRGRVEQRVAEYKAEMALEDLRRARNLTQVDLAKKLGIAQGAISKIEKREDMHVGTLRKHIEAMGGSLKLHAVFPDADVSVRLQGEAVRTIRGERAMVAAKKAMPAAAKRVKRA
jgi:transcriptional regulator with XRE-family HTH domain